MGWYVSPEGWFWLILKIGGGRPSYGTIGFRCVSIDESKEELGTGGLEKGLYIRIWLTSPSRRTVRYVH